MKKGQVYEGIIEKVEFPNKGIVPVPEEDRNVIVKNGIPGQKIRFCVNKFRKGQAEASDIAGSAVNIFSMMSTTSQKLLDVPDQATEAPEHHIKEAA